MFWRQTAQRLLVERGKKDVLPHLTSVIQDGKNPVAARHALAVIQGLGGFAAGDADAANALRSALKSASPAVRRAALAVLPRTAASEKIVLESGCLNHADPHVRLDALLALGDMPGSSPAGAAVAVLLRDPRNLTDPWIPTAAVSAAAPSALAFLLAATQPGLGAADGLAPAVRIVAGHLARQAPADATEPLLTALASANPVVAEAMLTGLASGWPADKPVELNPRAEKALLHLPDKLTPASMLQLVTLARRWGHGDKVASLTAGLRKSLLARVADAKLEDAARVSAGRELLGLSTDATVVSALLAQITPQASPALTGGLIELLGAVPSEGLGHTFVERWDGLPPAARSAMVTGLLRRPAWTRALLDGLEKGTIDRSDLSVEQVQLLTRHPDAALASSAARILAGGGRLPSPDRQKVLESLLPAAGRRGDRTKGRAVFESNCSKCHRHGALGQSVGPDLTGVGARPRADILIDIVDPNRSVEGNYRQYTVETKQGLL